MGFILTWLQTAVKVEYDHDETSQGQGKNHPDHSGFPHPESLWKPPRSRAQSCQGSGELHGLCRVYFTGRGSIDPARCSTFAAPYLPGHPRMPGQEEAAVREDKGAPGGRLRWSAVSLSVTDAFLCAFVETTEKAASLPLWCQHRPPDCVGNGPFIRHDRVFPNVRLTPFSPRTQKGSNHSTTRWSRNKRHVSEEGRVPGRPFKVKLLHRQYEICCEFGTEPVYNSLMRN